MKTCPNPECNKPCPDDANCCPYCGEVFPMTNAGSAVGDGATFTGGVHTTTTKTNSENQTNSNNATNSHNVTTTNNTTIYEAKKSECELLKENLDAYRLECKNLYKNGLLSKEGEDYLREIQRKYGLPDELVEPIKEEIQRLSRRRTTKLSLTVVAEVGKTKALIEQNSSIALQRHLMQLESWMQEYDDDSLKSWYYQLSAMLEPIPYTERYEHSAKDEFWEVYWAYIAYLLQNKAKLAYDARASLGRFVAEYSAQNDEVLGLAGRLMLNEAIDNINNDYKAGTIHCSKELQLLLDAIEELLLKDWSSDSQVRPAHSFYTNNLFKSFVNTQIEAGKKQREEKERMSRAERQRQEEINRQKEYLLQKFQEVKDLNKACGELNIPYLTFKSWLEDSNFSSRYNAIVRHIEEKRAEEAEQIRLAQEKEVEISLQKSHFKFLYEQNNCDLIKTCTEIGVGRDSVRRWRESDKAFDDALSLIEREHEKKLQDLFIQFYESNGCDLQKSSAETGVSVDDVNGWRKYDKSFNEILISIENEYVQAQKDAFKSCYKQNDCNLQKTCSELGLGLEVVKQWRRKDRSFDRELKYFEKLHSAKKRKDRFKKILPWLLIIILSAACVFGIMKVRSKYINEREGKAKIECEYQNAISNFNTEFSRVNTTNEGLNALEEATKALVEIIKLEQSPCLEGREESKALKKKYDAKVDNLRKKINEKATDPSGDEWIMHEGEEQLKELERIIKHLK